VFRLLANKSQNNYFKNYLQNSPKYIICMLIKVIDALVQSLWIILINSPRKQAQYEKCLIHVIVLLLLLLLFYHFFICKFIKKAMRDKKKKWLINKTGQWRFIVYIIYYWCVTKTNHAGMSITICGDLSVVA